MISPSSIGCYFISIVGKGGAFGVAVLSRQDPSCAHGADRVMVVLLGLKSTLKGTRLVFRLSYEIDGFIDDATRCFRCSRPGSSVVSLLFACICACRSSVFVEREA